MSTELPAPEHERFTQSVVDAYGANYGNFATDIYAEIRREAFGEDIGQQSWLTAAEQDRFMTWLDLDPASRVLDVGCGAGGPALRLARLSGCAVLGIDTQAQGLASATALAQSQGLATRVRFERCDGGQPLPYPALSFDAVVCIDAVNHLPERARVLAEWARVLKPGGRLLFTDPTIVTGPLSNAELAVRSSIGYYLFVPAGEDERLLRATGLEVLVREDVSENMAMCAQRRAAARAARAAALREIEGTQTYEGQQEFLRVTEVLARERRLSRFVYVAAKRA